MANKDKDKNKKFDMNRIEQIEYAWKENKKNALKADDLYNPEDIVEKSVRMSVSALKSTGKLVMELINTLNEENSECLAQPWIQNKITLANDYILAVHDYVMFHEEDDDDEENEMTKAKKTKKASDNAGPVAIDNKPMINKDT